MGFTAAADRGGFVGASSSSSSSRGDGGTTPSARDNTIHGVYGPHLVRRLELVLAHRAHAEGFVGCLRRAEAMAYVERDVGDHLRDAIHAAFDADGDGLVTASDIATVLSLARPFANTPHVALEARFQRVIRDAPNAHRFERGIARELAREATKYVPTLDAWMTQPVRRVAASLRTRALREARTNETEDARGEPADALARARAEARAPPPPPPPPLRPPPGGCSRREELAMIAAGTYAPRTTEEEEEEEKRGIDADVDAAGDDDENENENADASLGRASVARSILKRRSSGGTRAKDVPIADLRISRASVAFREGNSRGGSTNASARLANEDEDDDDDDDVGSSVRALRAAREKDASAVAQTRGGARGPRTMFKTVANAIAVRVKMTSDGRVVKLREKREDAARSVRSGGGDDGGSQWNGGGSEATATTALTKKTTRTVDSIGGGAEKAAAEEEAEEIELTPEELMEMKMKQEIIDKAKARLAGKAQEKEWNSALYEHRKSRIVGVLQGVKSVDTEAIAREKYKEEKKLRKIRMRGF
jgi:hypothetical protein